MAHVHVTRRPELCQSEERKGCFVEVVLLRSEIYWGSNQVKDRGSSKWRKGHL